MTVSDLILVNQVGQVIGGGKPGRRVVNIAGFQVSNSHPAFNSLLTARSQIHSAIHKARPEVNAICHSHSFYGKTFSTLGKPVRAVPPGSCFPHCV